MGEPDSHDATREGPPPVAYRRGRSPFRARSEGHAAQAGGSGQRRDPRLSGAHGDGATCSPGVTVAALALPSGMAYAEVAGPLARLRALRACSCRPCCTRSSARRASSSSGRKARSRRSSALPCFPWRRRGAARRRSSRRCSRSSSPPASCWPGSFGSAGWPTTSPARCSSGYIHGVAIVLVCGQLGKLLGIDIDASEPIGQVADAVGSSRT